MQSQTKLQTEQSYARPAYCLQSEDTHIILTRRKATTNTHFQQKHDAEQANGKTANNKQQTNNPYVLTYKQTQHQNNTLKTRTNK